MGPSALRTSAGWLEAVYRRIPGATRAAVMVHSHPHQGGSMYDRVLHHAACALHEAGISTLRFNFRGTGQSEGIFDPDGAAEDVGAAIARAGGDHADVAVVGFSFGAWVGIRVGAAAPRVSRLVALAAPVDVLDHAFLAEVEKPILVIGAEHDPWARAPTLSERYAAIPGPKRLVVVTGADHGFAGQLPAVAAEVTRWLADRVTAARGR
jgi:uncharacterized protein